MIVKSKTDFGSKLRYIRLSFGLTQHEFGRVFGISHNQIQKYETNDSRITVDFVEKLYLVFGVNPMYFLSERRKFLNEDSVDMLRFYYSIDERTKDYAQHFEIAVDEDLLDSHTESIISACERVNLLARSAADHYYVYVGDDEKDEWPITFHLYDSERAYIGHALVSITKGGDNVPWVLFTAQGIRDPRLTAGMKG